MNSTAQRSHTPITADDLRRASRPDLPTCHKDTPAADDRLARRAQYPAVDVAPAALVRETPYVRGVLGHHGVQDRDLPDVAQEVFITAWREIQEGRFRPHPDLALHDALRRWLCGFAWRHAMRYGRVPYRRHERFASELLQDLAVDATIESQVDARTLLELFERVPRKLKAVLVLIAFGAEPCEAAAELGISREAALQRIRNGREQFHRAVARWRRR
jgi:RNA polymerase sigma-70 factor, ECF subfamily